MKKGKVAIGMSEETKHTPGPWKLVSKAAGRRVIKGSDGKSVVLIEAWTTAQDACLIEATPDLFGACELALDGLRRGGMGHTLHAEVLEAAIAKAKGQSATIKFQSPNPEAEKFKGTNTEPPIC